MPSMVTWVENPSCSVSAAGAAAALSVWGAGAGWTPMTDTVLLLVLTT